MPTRAASSDYLDDDLVEAGFDDEAEDLHRIEQDADGADAVGPIPSEEKAMNPHTDADSQNIRKHRDEDHTREPKRTADQSKEEHQEDLLDEGIEESFPASDPVSVKHIT